MATKLPEPTKAFDDSLTPVMFGDVTQEEALEAFTNKVVYEQTEY